MSSIVSSGIQRRIHITVESNNVRRYLTFVKTTVSSKGQIVLPAELRQLDHIQPGQQFIVERIESGHYLLKREDEAVNQGVVDWLQACPADDWFQTIPSESTDP